MMIDLKENYSEEELDQIIVSTLGLTQENWVVDRGANQIKNYIDEDDSNKTKACEKIIYEWGDDFRFPINVSRELFWFDNDGNQIHHKVVKKVPISQTKLADINETIARRRIHYLEGAANNLRKVAESLPAETPNLTQVQAQYNQVADSIDFLFEHYRIQIQDYRERQSRSFEDAVSSESDATILAVLSLPVRQPDAHFPGGLTVKQSIIHQLTGNAYLYG